MTYPEAARRDLVEELHGHRVPDPYRWLEDPDDPATKDWSAEQDELARGVLDALPGRDTLAGRLTSLLDAGYVSAPLWRAGRRFAMRRMPGQEHGVLFVTEPDGRERVLIDPITLDPDGLTTLDLWVPDHDGRLLVYGLSAGGDEQSTLQVLDVDTGEIVDGPIDRCHVTSVDWLPGAGQLVYVRKVADARDDFRRRIHLRTLATGEERLVHAPGLYDDHTYYGVDVSRDGRWLVVSARVGTARRDSLWIGEIGQIGEDGAGGLTPVLTQADDVQCRAWVAPDGRLYLLTTDGAPRWRLAVADPENPGREHWRELIAEEPDSVLTGVARLETEPGAESLLVVARRRHAVSELALHRGDGTHVADIPLPGTGSLAGVRTADEATPAQYGRVWFGFTDLVTPHRVHRFDLATGTVELEIDSPGAVEVPPAHTEQRTFTSADGTTVRMFVVSPPGAGEPRPTLLYGYGGFANALAPAFSATALTWVAAGGTYVMASLRGGGEEGDGWYRSGRREHKQNTFDDLHAAAEALIAAGDTAPDQLAIMGGSNGGLLVGAALTQRPELYRAVVCSAPLLDMVRYEHFLLGRTWNDEYGTAEDPEQLGWLLSYSPYHHVRDGTAYPAVLFTVFDADTRVDPLHARKMCAALQHATTSDPATHPVLLRRESGVGHGARSVSRSVALAVDQLAFLAAYTGLEPA
ncbi:MAG: prolyl oligopeptidase family protein [Pseudonocardia sp.]